MKKRLRIFVALALLSASVLWAGTEVYFSGIDAIEKKLIRASDNSKRTIEGAIFDLTNQNLADALVRANGRKVKVRFVVDSRQARGKYSQVHFLLSSGTALKLARGRSRGIMHHKFAIFDDALLATGSYNWTKGAEAYNYENIIFTDDPAMIRSYKQEFNRLWRTH